MDATAMEDKDGVKTPRSVSRCAQPLPARERERERETGLKGWRSRDTLEARLPTIANWVTSQLRGARRKIPTGYENDGRGLVEGGVHRSRLSRELDFCQVAAAKVVVNSHGGSLLKRRTRFFLSSFISTFSLPFLSLSLSFFVSFVSFLFAFFFFFFISMLFRFVKVLGLFSIGEARVCSL